MFKVDDKIICVKTWGFNEGFKERNPTIPIKNRLPKIGTTYTVRGFFHYPEADYVSITVNEIHNQSNGLVTEIHFPITWFEKKSVLSIAKKELEENLCLN